MIFKCHSNYSEKEIKLKSNELTTPTTIQQHGCLKWDFLIYFFDAALNIIYEDSRLLFIVIISREKILHLFRLFHHLH